MKVNHHSLKYFMHFSLKLIFNDGEIIINANFWIQKI